jgi:pimeloyl-ACP methyl ester carboxylesterase
VRYAIYVTRESDLSIRQLLELSAASVGASITYDPRADVKILSADGKTFNPSLPTIIVTHGWHGTEDEARFRSMASKLAEAYPDRNVVRVMWQKGADQVLPWWASENIPAVADRAVTLLTEAGYTRWAETTYVGESFGNGVNARISQIAPAKGNALILNAANPLGYPWGREPDYRSAFNSSISIQTWDVADDGSNAGNRSILYRDPREDYCDIHGCNMTGQSNLGSLLRAQGDLAAAKPYYEQALAILAASLGPDHPTTQIIRNNLALLLTELQEQ